MKKINRKGFTLIELLVVIVILVVIMSIAIPSITSSIERSRQKQKDSRIKLILSAAELYVDSHRNDYSSNTTYKILFKNLICDNKITFEEAQDPFNETRTLCGYVSYTPSNTINKFKWTESTCTTDHYINQGQNVTCP